MANIRSLKMEFHQEFISLEFDLVGAGEARVIYIPEQEPEHQFLVHSPDASLNETLKTVASAVIAAAIHAAAGE